MHKSVLSKHLKEGATWVGIILKKGIERDVLRHGLESSGSRWGQVLAFCERGGGRLVYCRLGNVVK